MATSLDWEKRRYMHLVERFPLRRIRTQSEFAKALRISDELLERRKELSQWEKDYHDLLSDLIVEFENRLWPDDNVSMTPRDRLRHLMEANDLKVSDLVPEFGTHSRVSEFLSGKRDLSKKQIHALAQRFSMSTAAFMT